MANIYGELIKAQLENLAADIASPPTGIAYFNTVSNLPKFYDGASWRTLVTLTNTQTLTNKTLTGVVIGDYEDLTHIATPANPAAGTLRFYAKADNKIYKLTSAGVESEVAGSAAATATPTVEGVVTSYTPTVASGVLATSSATTTITDTDGYGLIIVDATAGDRTVVLPTLADNQFREITVLKADTSSNWVYTNAEGTETILGNSTDGFFGSNVQYKSMTFVATSSTWIVKGYQMANYAGALTVSNITGDSTVISFDQVRYTIIDSLVTVYGTFYSDAGFGEGDSFQGAVPVSLANFSGTNQAFGMAFGNENNSTSPYMVGISSVSGTAKVLFSGRGAQTSIGTRYPFFFTYDLVGNRF